MLADQMLAAVIEKRERRVRWFLAHIAEDGEAYADEDDLVRVDQQPEWLEMSTKEFIQRANEFVQEKNHYFQQKYHGFQ